MMLDNLKTLIFRLLSGAGAEDGQALTEYALVIALIALIAVLALTMLGSGVTNALTTVARPI
jgi:pilus assembly protein Flp/PilA